jgi:hypothetical protein
MLPEALFGSGDQASVKNLFNSEIPQTCRLTIIFRWVELQRCTEVAVGGEPPEQFPLNSTHFYQRQSLPLKFFVSTST